MPPKVVRRVLAPRLTKVNERIVTRLLISIGPQMDISLPLLKLGGLKNAEYLCGLNSPYSQNRTRDAAIQALEIQFLGNCSGEIQFLEGIAITG